MAGLKVPSSAAPKNSIARTSKSSKANNSSLSAEFVGDSDDDGGEISRKQKRHEDVSRKTKLTGTKPVAAKPNGLQSEPTKKRQSPKPASTKNVAQSNGTVKDSQDYTTAEEDSDANPSSQDSSPSPTKPTSAPPRTAHAKPSKPVSNGTISTAKTKPTTSHPDKHKVIDGTSEDPSRSGSSGGSGDSSGDESEEKSTGIDHTQPKSPKKPSPVPHPAEEPYEPPPGFKPASISLHPSSRLSELLAPSNLHGKEIWHIAVPASFPVAAIKDVSPKSIQTGESILSHKGADFGLVSESAAEASNCTLLFPSSQTKDYQLSTVPVVKALHLQQLVKLPNRALQVPEIPDPTSRPKTHVKTVRQQPEGLKMRYHAFGAPESSDSDESGKDAVKAPQFRVPDIPVRASKKRKLSNDFPDGVEVSTTANKKRKARDGNFVKAYELPVNAAVSMDDSADENSESAKPSFTKDHGTTSKGSQSGTKQKRKKKDGEQLKTHSTPTASQSILPQDLTKEAETIMPEEVVNIDAGVETTLPEEDPIVAKARRKKEKRDRGETEKANVGKTAGKPPTSGPIQHRSKSQSSSLSREPSVPLSTPKISSKQNGAATAKKNHDEPQDSSQYSQNQPSKEEKAKRKAERRKKNMTSDM